MDAVSIGQPPADAREEQLDLFAASGIPPTQWAIGTTKPAALIPRDLDDAALIAAIPDAGIADGPALAREAGQRALVAAIPALEALCRRFSGFGVDRAIPEQVASLEALATIGGREAAAVVERVIAKGMVQGPTLKIAVAAAAGLAANLPCDVVLVLLRHPDPGLRADACRCVRVWPEAVPVLLDLLDDLHVEVRTAAAFSLGRLGRREVLPTLVEFLKRAPSPDAIEAVTAIADEDCVVLLARLARTRPDLAEPALDALEVIDHPRAAQLLEAFPERGSG
jgi:hypothetical protein